MRSIKRETMPEIREIAYNSYTSARSEELNFNIAIIYPTFIPHLLQSLRTFLLSSFILLPPTPFAQLHFWAEYCIITFLITILINSSCVLHYIHCHFVRMCIWTISPSLLSSSRLYSWKAWTSPIAFQELRHRSMKLPWSIWSYHLWCSRRVYDLGICSSRDFI